MFKKNIFKILILCMALPQLTFASFGYKLCRFPSNYTLRQPSEDDKKLPAVLQLEKSMVDASANSYFFVALKFKNILETVIKELQTMPNTESAVQHVQTKMLNFEKHYEPCKTPEREQFMASLYPVIMDYYPLQVQESENDDVKTIVEVMKKYDVHNYKSIFQPEMADFVKTFEDKFQELKEPIERENKEFSNELNKWFEEVYNMRNDLLYKCERISNLPYQQFFIAKARNN